MLSDNFNKLRIAILIVHRVDTEGREVTEQNCMYTSMLFLATEIAIRS